MNSKLKFGFLLVCIAIITSVNLKPEALTPQQILDLVNADRASHGLSELELDPVLTLAALAKAEDMTSNNYFAHTSPEGITPWQWFNAMGYNYSHAGENLAEGYTDAHELEQSWMASAPHRANILSPHFEEVGLAIVEHKNSNVIVQLFGSKDAKLTLQ